MRNVPVSAAEKAFSRDIPADLHDEVFEKLSEAAWGSDIPGVRIIHSERRNVTNVEVVGSIDMGDGREFAFHLRDWRRGLPGPPREGRKGRIRDRGGERRIFQT